jgi:hypothetical protein
MNILLKRSYRLFLDSLPQTRSFDYLISLLIFWRKHKRLPKVDGGLFNDSLFYLKTTDEILDPLRVYVSDKEFVKNYVEQKIGGAYNVPTFGVVRSLEEAYRYIFPETCVIKPTHMSGPVMFRRNGSEIDFDLIESWFKSNYYLSGREANYKCLRPKLIIEPYIFQKERVEDYKFFCVNGKPCVIQVDGARHIQHTRNYYTPDWQELPFTSTHPKAPPVKGPDNLFEMLEIAAALSRDFSFIRVDLYSDDKSILVGELTNCPGNSSSRFRPIEGEVHMTRLLFGNISFTEHLGFPEKRSPRRNSGQRPTWSP